MAKWPEGTEPNPEVFTVEMIVEKFWEFRPDGRKFQSLKEDAAFFLRGWVAAAGRENVAEAYRQIMEKEEEDLALGGKPHLNDELLDWLMGRWEPPKQGRLRVYG